MISGGDLLPAKRSFVFRKSNPNMPMRGASRSSITCRMNFILLVLIAFAAPVRSETLDDAAKELARKISAALPAQENVSWELRNLSSLQRGEVARVEGVLESELHDRGIRVSGSGAAASIVVTLSEDLKGYVWTGEIRQGDASRAVLLAVDRPPESRSSSKTTPVALRSLKFWEGPEPILDAAEISDGSGKSWLVLLLPDVLAIQDKQSGSTNKLEIPSEGIASRDPRGQLRPAQSGNGISFFIPGRICDADWEKRSIECQWVAQPYLEARLICGATGEFLASGAGDYTETDSVQAFQAGPSGRVAISAELEFPGPIMALHGGPDAPRMIARNLKTGNYEAHRLSVTCEQ